MSDFSTLGLSEKLQQQVVRVGFSQPTPIQEQAIPNVLMNRDVVGIAQTGTGKTAAFVLPLLDILAHGRQRAALPRALVLNPTRELAMQTAAVTETFAKELGISHTLLIGGMTMGEQIRALSRAPDVVIATPGRLLDLHGRGKLLFNAITFLVIDEADRMLDMGFIPDVEKICALLPARRQTILMSATLDAAVLRLIERFTTAAKHIDLSPQRRSADTVAEVFLTTTDEKTKLALLQKELTKHGSVLVFCNRRQRVREVARWLAQQRIADVGQLHGDMPQPLRFAELERFRSGQLTTLVCSDVAARGLDIEAVDCVINFDVPLTSDNYVHRIGRTGRAGLRGIAITYVSEEDRVLLERIGMLDRIEGIAVASQGARYGRRDERREDGRESARYGRRDERRENGSGSGRSRGRMRESDAPPAFDRGQRSASSSSSYGSSSSASASSASSSFTPSASSPSYSKNYDKNEEPYGKNEEPYGKNEESYNKSYGKNEEPYGKNEEPYGKNEESYNKSYGKNEEPYGKNEESYNKSYGKNEEPYGKNEESYNKSYGKNEEPYGKNEESYNKSYGKNEESYNKSYGKNVKPQEALPAFLRDPV